MASKKHEYYLQQCADAASKSAMCFHLGAVLVKGGKIISTGYNHHRTHYDGSDSSHGQRKPVSMHAEMHAIYNATGFKQTPVDESVRTKKTTLPPNPSERSPLPSPRVTRRKAHSCLKGPKHVAGKKHHKKPRRGSGSGSEVSDRQPVQSPLLGPHEDVKLYGVRRRDARVNGADLYVARFTKSGFGGAKPCGRCVEWCRWAGVKRVFHWNPDVGSSGGWDVLKVNDPSNAYLTHADYKINARTFKAYAAKRIK